MPAVPFCMILVSVFQLFPYLPFGRAIAEPVMSLDKWLVDVIVSRASRSAASRTVRGEGSAKAT